MRCDAMTDERRWDKGEGGRWRWRLPLCYTSTMQARCCPSSQSHRLQQGTKRSVVRDGSIPNAPKPSCLPNDLLGCAEIKACAVLEELDLTALPIGPSHSTHSDLSHRRPSWSSLPYRTPIRTAGQGAPKRDGGCVRVGSPRRTQQLYHQAGTHRAGDTTRGAVVMTNSGDNFETGYYIGLYISSARPGFPAQPSRFGGLCKLLPRSGSGSGQVRSDQVGPAPPPVPHDSSPSPHSLHPSPHYACSARRNLPPVTETNARIPCSPPHIVS